MLTRGASWCGGLGLAVAHGCSGIEGTRDNGEEGQEGLAVGCAVAALSESGSMRRCTSVSLSEDRSECTDCGAGTIDNVIGAVGADSGIDDQSGGAVATVTGGAPDCADRITGKFGGPAGG